MEHCSRWSRFLAAAVVVALAVVAPLGALAHEHPRQTDSQCRICGISGADATVLEPGTALPAPSAEPGARVEALRLAPAAVAVAPGAPRAPPA